jgi:CubicO group peptidase (beta-lactamase class C family)
MRVVLAVFVTLVFAGCKIKGLNEKQNKYAILMNEYCLKQNVNGCVLLAKNDSILFKRAYGYADFEWNIENVLDTKFKIGSISKQFTAFLILRLVQDEIIDLHTPIKEHIPHYRGQGADVITIHQLLSHISGMKSDNTPDEEFRWEKLPHSTLELAAYAENSTLIAEPGMEFNYSNLGYNLLAHIAESVTNKSYGALIQEYISLPFDLKDTKHHNNKNIERKMAKGYQYDLLNGVENVKYLDDSYVTGSGSMVSTVLDLFKWSRILDTTTLLKKPLKDLLFKSNLNGYGYGWNIGRWPVTPNDTLDIQIHGGSVNGFTGEFSRIGNDKIVYIMLENIWGAAYPLTSYDPVKYEGFPKPSLHDIIIPYLYGVKKEMPKQSAVYEASKKLTNESVDTFIKTFVEFAKDTVNYYGDSVELNGVALALMNRNKLDEAQQVLEYSALQFSSFMSYAHLAEVHERKLNTAEALRYYHLAIREFKKPNKNNENLEILELIRKKIERLNKPLK